MTMIMSEIPQEDELKSSQNEEKTEKLENTQKSEENHQNPQENSQKMEEKIEKNEPRSLSLSAEIQVSITEIARDLNSNELVSNSFEITDIFKQHGIPIRYLGALRSIVDKPRLKALIMVEMVSIAWTRQLFDELQQKPPHFVSLLLKRLNLLLGLDPESKSYYDGELTDQVRSFFDLDTNLVYNQNLSNSREGVFLSLSKVVNGAMYFQLQKSISKHANLAFTAQFRSKINDTFKLHESRRKPVLRDSAIKSQISTSLRDSYLPQENTEEKKEYNKIDILDIEVDSLREMASAFELEQEDELEKQATKAKREMAKKEGSFSSLLKKEPIQTKPSLDRSSSIGININKNSELNSSQKDLKKELDLDDFEIVMSDPDSPTPKQQLEDVKRIKKQLGLGVSKIRDSIIQFIEEV